MSLNRTQQRILALLTKYTDLTISQIREQLRLPTHPYNDLSTLQNTGCVQQSSAKDVVSYEITKGGNLVLTQMQEQLQKA